MKLPFDEKQLILDNLPYLKRALKIESLAVHLSTDEDAVKGAALPVDVSLIYPGNPSTSFTTAVDA